MRLMRLAERPHDLKLTVPTDKLASYQVAHRELVPSVQHRRSKYLNNRAENSHQPTRQRERAMKRFKSIRHAQRFLSAFSGISPHFRPRRHLAVGGRLPTGHGQPLRGLERDHRGDDHGRRLNRRLGQDVSSKPRLITPNHHIGQLGWLKLTVPFRRVNELLMAGTPRGLKATIEACEQGWLSRGWPIVWRLPVLRSCGPERIASAREFE